MISQQPEPRQSGGQVWAPHWWAVLLIGLALWLVSVGVAYFTSNVILLPTIVLLGSFLIPVTAVVWYLDHDPSPELSPRRIVAGFIIAGVLGVLASSVIEFFVVFGPGPLGNLKVGLVEEIVKGAAILLVAWGVTSFRTRAGIVLGATVGFGFAALESSGYALASLFVVQGGQLYLSLTSVVITELVRGVLAPFSHGMWSGILGGVLFHSARSGRLRSLWWVVVAYLGVSILHAAFDSLGGIVGYVVISIIGLVPLVYLWWRGDRTGLVRTRDRTSSAPMVAQP
jgi:RsiW-degrading membrane proteinase PrsW (M82 family)